MARISISIPDELAARLEPVKDHLNVSQVCRDALEQRITTFEGTADPRGDESDLQGLASRFREEHGLAQEQWASLGSRNAVAWLSAASYLELKGVIDEGDPSRGIRKYKLPHAAFRIMKREMRRANGDRETRGANGDRETRRADGDLEGSAAVAYKTAWLDYVKAVWVQVEVRLDEPEDAPPQEAPAVSLPAQGESAD